MPWLVVLIYLVPIVGTITQIWRRMGQVWRMGDTLRAFLPEDRLYRIIREWDRRFVAWKKRHHFVQYPSLQSLNLLAGKFEYATGHARDYTIGLLMMGAFVYDLGLIVFWDPSIVTVRFPALFYHGVFALLTLWTYRRHVAIGLQLTEFMRINPQAHPEEFFDHYYRRLGPAAVPIPSHAEKTVDPTHADYTTGKPPKQTAWIWIHGAYDTAIFARSAFRALETLGKEYGREVFDVMASFWGSRMLQLFKAKMTVSGIEKFQDLPGKVILVFNHKTYLDFVFNFFCLSTARLASGRRIKLRFLAAKDHLYDNTIVYSGFGLGKLIEAVDMVFVDRKGKGKQAVQEAYQKILKKEIDIAMYPQGTRALANYGPHGERRDAGYYTTGRAEVLKTELGHLKKGCAHLAIDTALSLRAEKRPVHLVLIGTNGPATIQPKGSYKIQTEGNVECQIGEIITLSPLEFENWDESQRTAKVLEIQKKIDQGLVRALNLHPHLKNRLLEEVRRSDWAARNDLLKIVGFLMQADREWNQIPFMILDRIYALPPLEQPLFLKELASKISRGEELFSLRDHVTDEMCRRRGKEMRRVVLEEERKVAFIPRTLTRN